MLTPVELLVTGGIPAAKVSTQVDEDRRGRLLRQPRDHFLRAVVRQANEHGADSVQPTLRLLQGDQLEVEESAQIGQHTGDTLSRL